MQIKPPVQFNLITKPVVQAMLMCELCKLIKELWLFC